MAPTGEGLQQRLQVDSVSVRGILFEIAHRASQHGAHADIVLGGMMVKGDGNLNQSLEKLLFSQRRVPPNLFQNLVSGKELGAIEELNSTQQAMGAHTVLTQERVVAGCAHEKQQRKIGRAS